MSGKRRGTILFLARDPGGVQAILPVIRQLSNNDEYTTLIYSPPSSLFLYHQPDGESVPVMEMRETPEFCEMLLLKHRPDVVVTGTSIPAAKEKIAPEQMLISTARKRGIATLCILDFWGRYMDRFSHDGRTVYPDYVPDTICVMDTLCRDELLALGIDRDRIEITHNPYFDAICRDFLTPTSPSTSDILEGARNVVFASQPMVQYGREELYGYTQYSLFSLLVEELLRWDPGSQQRIIVWLHPKEEFESWENKIRNIPSSLSVVLSRKTANASGVLCHADFLVTSHSTVVYEALYYGIPCLSLQPDQKDKDLLVTNRLGLSFPVYSREALRAFLQATDFHALRDDLRRKRMELSSQRIFFSDGKATDRVCALIERTLRKAA